MTEKKLILVGLIYMVLGIIFSALSAHYLVRFGITGGNLQSFKVGNTYLIYTGLGFLALGGIVNKFEFDIQSAFRFILWGSVLFIGSVFLFAFLRGNGIAIKRPYTLITPIGGAFMILGWLVILIKYVRVYTVK